MKNVLRLLAVGALASAIPRRVEAAPPRILETHTAAPSVLVVVLETGPNNESGINTAPDTIDLTPANWRVNGQAPTAVYRNSIPLESDKGITTGNPDLFPVTVRHRIYLQTTTVLQNGQSYAITTPYGNTSLTFNSRATFNEGLKVNQVGYSHLATLRYANYGVYMGNGGTLVFSTPLTYEVIDESSCAGSAACTSGRVVATGQSEDRGDDTGLTGPKSGEHVYRLSLTNVPVGGPYFVSIPGFGRSRSFGVGNDYLRRAAATVARVFYHQRCGTALERPYTEFTRGICHARIANTRTTVNSSFEITGPYGIHVPDGTPTRPMRGGWHDAGNFQRRAQHAFIPIVMLGYYEAFPTHFVDNQYNIPESGNGIPDLLDEAFWGALQWENLQISDSADPQYGGIQAGTMEDHQPAYGVESAASSPQTEGTFQVTEYTSAYGTGILAQVSRLIRPYDAARAEQLLQKARLGWAYLTRTSNVSTPKTYFMYAALQLYLATGEQSFHDTFKTQATAILVPRANGDSGVWPDEYDPGNFGNAGAQCQTVHFISYLLSTPRAVDATLVQTLKKRILDWAALGGYMNVNADTAPYAYGANKFYAWGGSDAGRHADVFAMATLFEPDAAKRQRYYNQVSALADYSLGLNPMGLSHYTALGTDYPVSPVHLDSYFTKYGMSDGITSDHLGHPIGNIPGIPIYGIIDTRSLATYQRAVNDKLYPVWDSRPILERFAGGWPNINQNEFTVWETVDWDTTALFGFLYNASADTGTPPTPPPTNACTGSQPPTELQYRSYTCTNSTWTAAPWQPLNVCAGQPAQAPPVPTTPRPAARRVRPAAHPTVRPSLHR